MTVASKIERVPLLAPFTPMEGIVAKMLASGQHNWRSIAEHMGCSWRTVKFHGEQAKKKIPGDLPTQLRIVAWYRGASMEVLTGSQTRQEGYYQPVSALG